LACFQAPFPLPLSRPRQTNISTGLRPLAGEAYIVAVSANELLEMARALPPRELRRFLAGVRKLEGTDLPTKAIERNRRVRWPDSAVRRRKIFGDKTLPNLVLLAREQERY
jgi:hypothetical protein